MTRSTSTSTLLSGADYTQERLDEIANGRPRSSTIFTVCSRSSTSAPVRSAAWQTEVGVTQDAWAASTSRRRSASSSSITVSRRHRGHRRHSASRVDPCPARRRLRPERVVDQQRRRHLRSLSRARCAGRRRSQVLRDAAWCPSTATARTRTTTPTTTAATGGRPGRRSSKSATPYGDSYTTFPYAMARAGVSVAWRVAGPRGVDPCGRHRRSRLNRRYG